ncbi:hypothetical protein CPB83DRAFT_842076 [Crepidotus variabilis]|uniref:Uncharacterized protein n=1 Tax=Crepidotus variabilis TaxID=179855 RepID=A0A9P6EUB4_9AGAR|nr:hypothetical protein CPB83DRAFT_842076 [Crepidotus variabilis]
MRPLVARAYVSTRKRPYSFAWVVIVANVTPSPCLGSYTLHSCQRYKSPVFQHLIEPPSRLERSNMPSVKSRANKAAIAARVAAYNASLAALEEEARANGNDAVDVNDINPVADMQGVQANGNRKVISTPMPLKPTLPSMLNLNTPPNLNRALSVGAVLTQRPIKATGSDEENVPIASKTEVVGHNGDNTDANRQSLASPSIGGKERDLRAFEIARQRAKRAEELEKRKAKKVKEVVVTAVNGQGHNRGTSESGVTLGQGISRKKSNREMDEDLEEAKMPSVRKGGVGLSSCGGAGVQSSNAAAMEVSLSDLIVPSHRKPRKVKEEDYEFISPVRSVIILDDMFETKEMDLDEPWEHIDSAVEFGIPSKEGDFSYAAVLASGA